jgi:RimJ/RimL family protein N-acetyltransferase
MAWVLDGDPEIDRFTRIPSGADGSFLVSWLDRYERGWEDGDRAGFAVRDARGGGVIGFAAYVQLDLERQEGEIGYAVHAPARGRGAARRAVGLLTRWGFDALRLERIELRIDPSNAASARVAERSGYRLDGVLRNTYFKDGLRSDTGVWSRLAAD